MVYWSIIYVLWKRKKITKCELRYAWGFNGAWRVLLFCGILDCTAEVLGYIAQPHIPVIIFSLSNQTNLFWIAIWSSVIFGRRYIALECFGIALAWVGAMLAVSTLNSGSDDKRIAFDLPTVLVGAAPLIPATLLVLSLIGYLG